jgi:hypothetical protein
MRSRIPYVAALERGMKIWMPTRFINLCLEIPLDVIASHISYRSA